MDVPAVITGFDLETTGVNPYLDQIVTACVGVLDTTVTGDGRWHPSTWLLKQDGPIPAEATAVHGVTTGIANRLGLDHAAAVIEIRDALVAAWEAGGLVVGHNVAYDLTMLTAELAAIDQPPLQVGPVFDTLVADKSIDQYRRGSRRLDACWAKWGDGDPGDLHRADTDARLAAEIAVHLCPKLPPTVNMTGLNKWMAAQYHKQTTSLAEYWTRTGKTAQVASLRYQWPVNEKGCAS